MTINERSFSDVYNGAFESIGAGSYDDSGFEDFRLQNPLPELDSTDLYASWQNGVYLTEHPLYDRYTKEQKIEADEIAQRVRYLGYTAIARAGVGLAKSNFLATWDDELGLEAVDNNSVGIYFRFRAARDVQSLVGAEGDGSLEPSHSPEIFDEWPETDRPASCLAIALGMAALATEYGLDYKFTTAIRNNASQVSEYHRGYLDEFHKLMGVYLEDRDIDEVVNEIIEQQEVELPEFRDGSTFFNYIIRSRDSRMANIEAHNQFHHYITTMSAESVDENQVFASVDPYQSTLSFSVMEDSPLSRDYRSSETVVDGTRHLEWSLVPHVMSLKFLSEKVNILESDIDSMDVRSGRYLEGVIDAVYSSFLECQESRDDYYKLLRGEYDPEAQRVEGRDDEVVRLLSSNAVVGIVRRYFNDDSAVVGDDGGGFAIAPKYSSQMALDTELRDSLKAKLSGALIGLEAALYIRSIAGLGVFGLGEHDAAYEYGDNYFMAGSSYLCNFTSGSRDDTVSLAKELTKVGSSQMIWQSAKVTDGFASKKLEMEFDQVIGQLPKKAIHPLVSIRRHK